jgi:outer membrane protein assembly factor BamE
VPHKLDVQQGNEITQEMREKIKVGMTPAVVRSVLGTPLIMDPFHAKRWDYVYILEQGGKMVDRQRLTLYFDDEKLARIDDSNMPVLAGPVSSTNKK